MAWVFFTCNVAVIEFFVEEAKTEEFKSKRVLEVGSKYVNGSARPLVEKFLSPSEYVGVDIEPGKYVDLVVPAEELVKYFGVESFDVVISTELLEHVLDWRLIVRNLKEVLRPKGYMYITTRSMGFPYHSSPYDFWRYELDDLRKIFRDLDILTLKKDHEAPGVFLKARKPEKYAPADLSAIALYCIILGRRTKSIPNIRDEPITRRAQRLMMAALLRFLRRRRFIPTFG